VNNTDIPVKNAAHPFRDADRSSAFCQGPSLPISSIVGRGIGILADQNHNAAAINPMTIEIQNSALSAMDEPA